MRIRLTRHAASDLELAHDHYAGVEPELGKRFLDEVDTAIERITMFPAGAPPVEGFDEMRRARIRRFPYGIFYRQTDAGIELLIVRVLHTRHDHRRTLP